MFEDTECLTVDEKITLLMRYPAQVADQSENLLPFILRYTGFLSLDQFNSF